MVVLASGPVDGQRLPIPGTSLRCGLGSPPTTVLLADPAILILARVHVNQYAGIAFEKLNQQLFQRFGFCMSLIKAELPGEHQMKIDMDEAATAPSPQLMDVNPKWFAVFFQ